MTHFSDKRLDTVAMAARIEADPAKRALLLDEAQEILMQKLPWIPVVETKLQFAVQDSIKGVVLQSSQNLMWRDLHR
jgi:ABC-type transport system substrate-binding protein